MEASLFADIWPARGCGVPIVGCSGVSRRFGTTCAGCDDYRS